MSVKTIYKCDKCGFEQESSEQFWTVGVTARQHDYTSSTFATGKSMQVCRPCLESLGINMRTKPDDPKYVAPPTLEDLIMEIVRRGIEQTNS